jgi:hypothetical protein
MIYHLRKGVASSEAAPLCFSGEIWVILLASISRIRGYIMAKKKASKSSNSGCLPLIGKLIKWYFILILSPLILAVWLIRKGHRESNKFFSYTG